MSMATERIAGLMEAERRRDIAALGRRIEATEKFLAELRLELARLVEPSPQHERRSVGRGEFQTFVDSLPIDDELVRMCETDA